MQLSPALPASSQGRREKPPGGRRGKEERGTSPGGADKGGQSPTLLCGTLGSWCIEPRAAAAPSGPRWDARRLEARATHRGGGIPRAPRAGGRARRAGTLSSSLCLRRLNFLVSSRHKPGVLAATPGRPRPHTHTHTQRLPGRALNTGATVGNRQGKRHARPVSTGASGACVVFLPRRHTPLQQLCPSPGRRRGKEKQEEAPQSYDLCKRFHVGWCDCVMLSTWIRGLQGTLTGADMITVFSLLPHRIMVRIS
ncbi:uncharacterized protein [Emydura macquarii macquarii]|uniref:uncharacterized protein isoform X1 n=1 Tax=Emydura macquarii macquarii TaxID=1129001 RepID=UPI003529DA08